MVISKKRNRNIPSDAIITDRFSNGDIVYIINFELDGREYHHVNHINSKGMIKSNTVYTGKHKEKEYA